MQPLADTKQSVLSFLYDLYRKGKAPNAELTKLSEVIGASIPEIHFACKSLEDESYIEYNPLMSHGHIPQAGYVRLSHKGVSRIEDILSTAVGRDTVASIKRNTDTPFTCFVIMRFGDANLDMVYNEIITKSISDNGFIPKRVDRDHNGRLISKAILDEIANASAIVADLTGERPNCYAEVGYVLGLRKEDRMILCAREDHDPRKSGRKDEDPKVHFDFDGYYIEYWHPDKLSAFHSALSKRLASLRPSQSLVHQSRQLQEPVIDPAWLRRLQTHEKEQ